MKTNVYFTVDTEASMGGAWADPQRRPVAASRHVFCQTEGDMLGIPLIVRTMAKYGFRATYFVETLSTLVLGEADTASVFDFLLEHHQDIQLHIHPTFRYYAEALRARADGQPYNRPPSCDSLAEFAEDVQLDLLGEASRLFTRFAGRPPMAFRAGNYSASNATLRCLRALGIAVDSSYNPCYPEESFRGETPEVNRVRMIEGVWEIPVTVARSSSWDSSTGLKFADCTALSVREITSMLEASVDAGQEHFVIVFHSFCAAKAKDIGYTQIRPNRVVISRLDRLFAWLAKNSDRFRVSTMGDAATEPEALASAGKSVIGELGLLRAAVRKSVQLVNTLYWT